MKSVLKALILVPIRLAGAYSRAVARLWLSACFAWTDLAHGNTRDSKVTVGHSRSAGSLDLTCYTPHAMHGHRTETFSTKRPETVEWIDRFGSDGAFYAFEPSVFSLGLPAKNITINDLSYRVVIVPNRLTSENQLPQFHSSMHDEGGSMSTYGVDTGHDGGALNPQQAYGTTGMALDFIVEQGLIPQTPTMVDVDGIEQISRLEADQVLDLCGLALVERRHSDMFVGGAFENTYN